MRLYNKVYIGYVETVNLDVNVCKSPIESKVIVLKQESTDKNRIVTYKPLRKYNEYYKLVSVDKKPLTGTFGNIIGDNDINQALKKTGKQEVKKLKKC